MRRRLRSLRLHSTTHLEGVGEIPAALPSGRKSFAGLEMYYTEQGVEVTFGKITAIFPLANVQVAEFAAEDSNPDSILSKPRDAWTNG